MSEYDTLEDLDTFDSDDEFDEAFAALIDEDEEAARRRRRPARTSRGQGYYRARPTNRYVTQAQLQAALAKVGKDVKGIATSVSAVGARVDTVKADQAKQLAMMKKEAAERRKDTAKLKSGMQMAALLPMLTSKTITVKAGTEVGGTKVTEDTRLAVAPDSMAMLLPMLMMGDGFGGGSGGDSSNMLFLALALSGGFGK